MKFHLLLFVTFNLCIIIVQSLELSDEVEIMHGYDLETPLEHLSFYEPDESNEKESLTTRNRREIQYRVLESPGLRSHFHLNNDYGSSAMKIVNDHHANLKYDNNNNEFMQNIAYTKLHPPPLTTGAEDDYEIRYKRDVSEIKLENDEEILPTPEKQYADEEYFKRSRPISSSYSNEFPKALADDDSISEASINEGIKARAPRVNFVTQNKKTLEAAEARDRPLVTKPAEYYRRGFYDDYPVKYYDDYNYQTSRRYDMYPRKYDRYDRELNSYHPRYDSFEYRKRYDDDYIPRTPNSFYYYPNSQYDLPEPRDFPTRANEIERMVPPPPSVPYHPHYNTQPNNRRIIYYATLPEVVRTPPNVDLRYKSSYERSYDPLYNRNYNAQQPSDRYRSNRSPRYYSQQPVMISSSRPLPSLTSSSSSGSSSSISTSASDNKDIKSNPVRISNSLHVKDQQQQQPPQLQQTINRTPIEHRNFNIDVPSNSNGNILNNNNNNNNSNNKNIRPNDQPRQIYQDGVDERDQTYFSRNH